MKIQDREPAKHLIKKYCEYYNERRMDAILQLCAKHITLWGTGVDEFRVGLNEMKAQLERDWGQSSRSVLEIVSFVEVPERANWMGSCVESI